MTPIVVVEGEKAADCAASLGLHAVASLQGARSPQCTDWTPLAGKDCVVLEDNDEAGAAYGEAVAGILTGLGCKVRRKNLGGAKGDDIVDFVAANKRLPKALLRRKVLE